MTEHLGARSVLADGSGGVPRMFGDAATVRLTEQAPAGAIALRLDSADAIVLQSVHEALGMELPLTPNTWHGQDGTAVLWQAYDEWLVLTADGRQTQLAARLTLALAGRHSAVTDISDLQAEFLIEGPASRDLLRKGCAVDLHPRIFSTGHLALTALARVRVVLWQTAETPAYRLRVERSHAHYLWDWLVDAGREFLGG